MKSQSSPIYTYEEMQEVKDAWVASTLWHQLIIIVLMVTTILGWLYY